MVMERRRGRRTMRSGGRIYVWRRRCDDAAGFKAQGEGQPSLGHQCAGENEEHVVEMNVALQ
jgi:hypothetical protein